MTDKFDMFKLAGVNKADVIAWQKNKKLEHLPPKAALQLYCRVVLKKPIRPPYPIITVEKLWEKIEAINAGIEPAPNNNKLFYGLKDITVVGLNNSLKYVGCPICLKGQKRIGASKCSAHGSQLVELESLAWNEWLAYGERDEFVIKMSPKYSKDFNELNMIGASLWVEGTINLDEDPIVLMVSKVWDFKPGNLMLGNIDDDDNIATGDDFTSGRADVDLSGFEESTDMIETVPKRNPFIDNDDDIEYLGSLDDEVEESKSIEVDETFKKDFLKEFDDMMKNFVTRPIKKTMVERYLLDWIENSYPTVFKDLDKAKELIWSLPVGRYKFVGQDKIARPDFE